MKANISLIAKIWQLNRNYLNIKHWLFGKKKTRKTFIDPLPMDIQKVAAESKRIAEKLQDIELRLKESKSKNKSVEVIDVPEKNSGIDSGQILCRWREDEDDRYSLPELRGNCSG